MNKQPPESPFMAKTPSRRLTTIFYADAVGFGQQMANNEDQALAALQRYRELMQDRFNKYDGRLVNTWGDAVIAEFSSVVEAVRCAVDVQDSIAQYESGPDALDTPMAFRIGINLGDVMVDGDDLAGDGVNIAARLEAMAPVGGILVSRSVYEFAHKQLAVTFEDEGEQVAKNGEDTIAAYSIRLGTEKGAISRRSNNPLTSNRVNVERNTTDGSQPVQKTSVVSWVLSQPKHVQFALGMIAFLFMINLMTTGLTPPWFLYPTGGLLLMILLSSKRRKDN